LFLNTSVRSDGIPVGLGDPDRDGSIDDGHGRGHLDGGDLHDVPVVKPELDGGRDDVHLLDVELGDQLVVVRQVG